MIFFIDVIRALSALIITNAHYTGVYPTDLIANGGLLGDVLFFAVSGYCLSNIKLPFHKWYVKRIIRIYPPVLIITAVYAALGFYQFDGFWGFIKLFIYPTYYHFVASIVLLYIPFYFVMKIEILRKRIPLVIGAVFLIQLIIYLFFYDRTYYHIDSVHNWMIRFLFFIAMLIGAYVRINDNKIRNKRKTSNLICTIILVPLYFASKLFFVKFSKISFVSQFQIINQIILLILLYFIFVPLQALIQSLRICLKCLEKRFCLSAS
ncbi:MAG: acyltransferase family protein [Oscillospiraceae bacterium]